MSKALQCKIFSVKIRQIFTHRYSYNNQNIPTWIKLLEWSSYVHISPCVVSVMAAAAADFPGLPKPSTVANLSQHTSGLRSIVLKKVSKIKNWGILFQTKAPCELHGLGAETGDAGQLVRVAGRLDGVDAAGQGRRAQAWGCAVRS